MERQEPTGGEETSQKEIAHQLRDLLTACKGYVELVGRSLSEPEMDREHITMLNGKALKYLTDLNALVDQHYGTPPAIVRT